MASRVTRAAARTFRAAPTSGLATPADWLVSALGGGRTKSGKVVSVDASFYHPDVFGCLRVLCDAAAMIPLHAYKEETDGTRQRVTRTSLVGKTLLYPSRSYRIDQSNFNSVAMLHLNTWGDFFAGKVRNNGALVDELIPISPRRVELRIEGNDIAYIVQPTTSAQSGGTFYRDDIYHCMGMSKDGFRGLGPIGYAREMIGTGITFEEYAGGLAGNQFAPPIYLKHPGKLGSDAANSLTENFKKKFFGQQAIAEIPVLEEGVELATPVIPAKDAQFILQRNFNTLQVCRIFHVPPWKLGAGQQGSSMTYANVEQEQLDFVMWSVYPWLHRLEQSMWVDEDLFGVDGPYYPEYLLDAALRADSKTRAEIYNVAVGRWMTQDEIRDRENMPRKGGAADELGPVAADATTTKSTGIGSNS
jgi:HK97 family phage portal protein